MIYLTGDTHGNFNRLLLLDKFIHDIGEENNENYLIVCGDFGGIWRNNFSCFDTYHMITHQDNNFRVIDKLSNLCFKVLWIDGNHENFNEIKRYKASEWSGGKVQFISPNCIHLCRGEVYTIEGIKILTLGGADSIDRDMRLEWLSWWKEENITLQEFNSAVDNITKNPDIDFIISHDCPVDIKKEIAYRRVNNYDAWDITQNNRILSEIDNLTPKRKLWYFGHYHNTETFNKDGKTYVELYKNFVKIGYDSSITL